MTFSHTPSYQGGMKHCSWEKQELLTLSVFPIHFSKAQARLLILIHIRIFFSFKVKLIQRSPYNSHALVQTSFWYKESTGLVNNFHRVLKPKPWTGFISQHCHFLAVTLGALIYLRVNFVFCKLRVTSIPTCMSIHVRGSTAPSTKVFDKWSETLLMDLAFGFK